MLMSGKKEGILNKSTPGNMFHHVVSYRRSLVLILCTILFLETQADSDICNTCNCNSLTTRINCINRNLLSIPQPIPTNVKYLDLGGNNIATIKEGAFTGLSKLKELRLWKNNIATIKEGAFTGLSNLKYLYLINNPIEKYEDGAFLFLPSIATINLPNNNLMKCGCHLPAFVKYIKEVYNRTVDVFGTCQEGSGKRIPILDYSQCQSWTKSLVIRLIFKKFNEYKIPAENISRAIEHDLSTVTGTFRVEDCGSNRNKIFAIYCTVFSEMTESQLRRNISQVLNKSQELLNLGVKKSHMKFIDEMVCDESTTSTNNRAFSWPMTKIGTTAEIPCHGNVATRHCSSRTMGHPEMASSQNLSSQKCSPFTGIWQEPDMSQCYNAEQSKGIDDGWTKSFAFRLILKSFNEYKKPAENISRAMEHEFLTVTGKFRVEYPGVQSQLRRNISQVLNKFQALLNMNLFDESSSTGNGTEDRTAETNF
ncbi:adhesion G-protein coupled receptor G6-like isoform X2 [Octopus vulgaris]|uniref:Adhesion G-protein coupled receptor G6-like isoform X2 n=1 Tax=Octopus vulgaris TaxID=6645 RepID=A0AA36HIS7_OCTVU|nr:adhesion G-protein coupled receptor G6-like isoform X2 [Octopus vulgaris]